MRHLIAAFLFAALFFSIGGEASAYSIRDDATGGDCTLIGTWDSATKTCKLATNLSAGLQLDSAGITVDGNGRTVTGSGIGYDEVGVFSRGHSDVTIKNLKIENFYLGVFLRECANNTVKDNIISARGVGIYLTYCANGLVENNVVTGGSWGILVYDSDGNAVKYNTISSVSAGLALYLWSAGNEVVENNIYNNGLGIYIYHSADNKVYNNTIENNGASIQLIYGDSNVFNLDSPIGGNYWGDFHTPEDGCNDLNVDGFCDTPYYVAGWGSFGADYLPWTLPGPWQCKTLPEIDISSLSPKHIWPPDRKIKELKIAGKIILPQSCSLLDAGYRLDDEYGSHASEGRLQLDADNNFILSLKVEAWRNGGDIDGRHYTIRLYAADEMGAAEKTLEVIVPHGRK